MRLKTVVLPAPLGPMSAGDRAGGDVERGVVDGGHGRRTRLRTPRTSQDGLIRSSQDQLLAVAEAGPGAGTP